MWGSMLKVVGATAVFAVVHSALASWEAKEVAVRVFGRRHRNGLYRVLYNAQAVATFGLLCAYIRRLPNRELYRVRGPARAAMHAGQAAGLLTAVAAARQVGIPRITGLASLAAWRSDGPVPAEPEAQGPSPGPDGALRIEGPFRSSRHPLNFAPLPVLWLWPRMTTNLLALNIAATAYLILGSRHEESRLLRAYGDRYADYLDSGVPFYLPRPQSAERLRSRSNGPAVAPTPERQADNSWQSVRQ